MLTIYTRDDTGYLELEIKWCWNLSRIYVEAFPSFLLSHQLIAYTFYSVSFDLKDQI